MFNEPVDPQAVSRWLSIEERSNGYAAHPAFSVRRANDDELIGPGSRAPLSRDDVRSLSQQRERSIVILAAAPFRKESTVKILCKAGLQGKQGRLGMTTEYSSSFTTYGDLKFVGLQSDNNFDPKTGLRLEFSNPVLFSAMAAHLVITPAARLNLNYGDEYQSDKPYLYLDLRPEQEYACVLKAGLKDIFGNSLAADVEFTFHTSAYEPYVRMTTGPGLLEAREAHTIPVSFMNNDSVSVRMGLLSAEQIVPLMTASDFWGNDAWSEALLSGRGGARSIAQPPVRVWKISHPRNTGVTKPLDLNDALGASRFGVVFVQLDNALTDDPRVLKTVRQVPDIGVPAKFCPDSIVV